ncbi:MAG: ATP-binding domain-containing protein [Candidatus Parcubacteria bacterium]|nr:ATP-binding domain-containing protein [Candidatus Paceibacterota bacterium]
MIDLSDENDLNTQRSLFVTGDDGQSIYGFRGSTVDLILNFEEFYPKSREIILNQNYRSTKAILDLAEKILSLNPRQKFKELFTDNPDTNLDVNYYIARNHQDEGRYIVRHMYNYFVQKDTSRVSTINTDLGKSNQVRIESFDDEYVREQAQINNRPKSGISNMFDTYLETSTTSFSTGNLWQSSDRFNHYNPNSWNIPTVDWEKYTGLNSVAVLYRTHAQSQALEAVFNSNQLPYRLVSGTRFLDRKEVKDVISILRFAFNSQDKLAIGRFLPLILDGVGPKTLEKIIAFMEDSNYPLAPKYQDLVTKTLGSISQAWLSDFPLIDFCKSLIESLGYLAHLKKNYPVKEEYDSRLENIQELYSLMLPFDTEESAGEPLYTKLGLFLERVSLMSNMDNKQDDNTPKINLMTLHQSKGLEFDIVFLVGIEDGLLPHQNSLYEPNGLEEEVRLAYVGVTRAKKQLHLISAESRVLFGQIKAMPVSRIFRPFLDRYSKRVID